MEIFLSIIFWLAILVALTFIHLILLGLVSMVFVLPIRFIGIEAEIGVLMANCAAAILLYGFFYNYLWLISFGTYAPILFYILGLVAAWAGSGSKQVEANEGNKLMTSGEVLGIFFCIGYAYYFGASFV